MTSQYQLYQHNLRPAAHKTNFNQFHMEDFTTTSATSGAVLTSAMIQLQLETNTLDAFIHDSQHVVRQERLSHHMLTQRA